MRRSNEFRWPVIIVHGRKTAEIDREALLERIAAYGEVVIDVGAGDGRFVYSYAREHPDRFVIGLDPVKEAMQEFSGRIGRRRTRLENALYVVGSVEQMPAELAGLCNQIFIILPWGSLMRGLILADDKILTNLASIAAPGCHFRIILNTRIFDDPVPVEASDLPEATPAYVEQVLLPAYAGHGLQITATRMLAPQELLALPTTWARRLSHREPPRSLLVEGVKDAEDSRERPSNDVSGPVHGRYA